MFDYQKQIIDTLENSHGILKLVTGRRTGKKASHRTFLEYLMKKTLLGNGHIIFGPGWCQAEQLYIYPVEYEKGAMRTGWLGDS